MNSKNEKIIVIIIARGGSKSIPRKNLLSLKSKPLVAWPIELAKSIKRVDRVIVSTDDDEIMKVARKYGAEVLFKRPAELAADDTPTLPVLQHCIKFLEKTEKYKPDIILLLYPTSPFLKKERIEEALNLFDKTDCNSVISVAEDKGRFWSKKSNKYTVLYPPERINRQYYPPLYRENGAIYFSRRDVLVKTNKMVDEDKVEFLIMKPEENVDIDDLEDFKKIKI